ncbi:MAG: hypothetical protein ACLUJG_08595 [Lawsonibacter sp.]
MERAENGGLAGGLAVELEGHGLSGRPRVQPTGSLWMDADGTVSSMTAPADPAAMENHNDREEIQEALDSRAGHRHPLLRHPGGADPVLAPGGCQTATVHPPGQQPADSHGCLLLAMVQPILASSWSSPCCLSVGAGLPACPRRIIRPIAELDLEHPEDSDTYDELALCLPASGSRTRPSRSRWASCAAEAERSSPPSPKT